MKKEVCEFIGGKKREGRAAGGGWNTPSDEPFDVLFRETRELINSRA